MQRNQKSNCQYPLDHRRSNRVPEKHLFLLYWLCQNLWLCGWQHTVENSERAGNTRPPDLPSWEIHMQVKKQQLELDVEQQTGSKLGREYVKAVLCHPACLTCMQSISWEMLGWRKHKLESRLPGEISVALDMQIIPPLWQKVMAPHSSTLAWKIPWTEEPGRLQSMGSLRVGHDWVTSLSRIGEGNGNPLQCSCLENPRDRGAW